MPIKEIVNRSHSHWMDATGADSDIVISSRMRVARNLAGIPFPHLLNREKSGEVIHALRLAIKNQEAAELLGSLELCELSELTPLERQILVDKHLISPEFLNNPEARAVVLRDDEVVSIMVNEEDHLRIQCLLPGLALKEAWNIIDKIDDGLKKPWIMPFAKAGLSYFLPHQRGHRHAASVMLHLPALKLTKQLYGVLNAIGKLGLTVRGLYGEGTEALGICIKFPIKLPWGSRRRTYQQPYFQHLPDPVPGKSCAQILYQKSTQAVEDRVYRAYGTLKYARLLSSEEAMRLISDLRLGVALNIIPGIRVSLLNELMVKIRPAFLNKISGQEMMPPERKVYRAGLVRKELGGVPC